MFPVQIKEEGGVEEEEKKEREREKKKEEAGMSRLRSEATTVCVANPLLWAQTNALMGHGVDLSRAYWA